MRHTSSTSRSGSSCSAAGDGEEDESPSSSSSTAAAFWRWRLARCKAQFRLQLQELLADVAAEEQAAGALQRGVKRAQAEEQCLRRQLAEVQAQLADSTQQLYAQQAHADQLQASLDALDAEVCAPLAHRLASVQEAQASEAARHAAAQAEQQQLVAQLKAEQLQLLQEHAELLAAGGATDQALARATCEAATARQDADAARQQAAQLEDALRLTGQRAAAAEDTAHRASESIIALQTQLADLTEQYRGELAHGQALRAAAAESAHLRERAAEASAAAAALAASRTELRAALDEATASLAAAHERCRQLEGARGAHELLQASLLADATNSSGSSSDGELVAALAQQLDAARAELQQVAPQLAAAGITMQQQRKHIEQLAGELRQAQAAQAAATDRSEVVGVLNAQLQASIRQRDNAPAAPGGQQQPSAAAAAAGVALLLSQLQEQAGALLAAERAASRQQTANPSAGTAGAVTVAAAMCGKAAAVVQEVVAIVTKQQQVQDAAVLAAGVHAAWKQVQDQALSLAHLREQLRALQAQGQLWQGVLAALAGAGEAVTAARRACTEACTGVGQGSDAAINGAAAEAAMQQVLEAEAQLAAALSSAEAPASDPAQTDRALTRELEGALRTSAAATAVRSAAAGLQELAAQLAACLPPESSRDELHALAGSVVETEALLHDAAKAVSSTAAGLGDAAASLTAALAHLQPADGAVRTTGCLLQQLEQQLLSSGANNKPAAALHHQDADAVSEAAALQLEVAALSLTLQRREQEVQALRANEKRLLSANGGLVPAELLLAARSGQDEAACQAAAAAQQLEQAAAAQQVAAGAFVERVAARMQDQRLRLVILRWHQAAAISRAVRLASELETATATWERSRRALAVFCARISATAAAQARLHTAAGVLAAWQQRVTRQQRATWTWRGWSELLLQQRRPAEQPRPLSASTACRPSDAGGDETQPVPPGKAGSAALISRTTKGRSLMQQQLLQRRRRPAGSCAEAMSLGKLLNAALRAWRMVARLEARNVVLREAEQRVEAMSAGLPAWIAQLGDRRRLERAWLAWRLAATRPDSTPRWQQQEQEQEQPEEPEASAGASPAAAGGDGCEREAAPADAAAAAAVALPRPALLAALRRLQQQPRPQGEPRWQIAAPPSAVGGVEAALPPPAAVLSLDAPAGTELAAAPQPLPLAVVVHQDNAAAAAAAAAEAAAAAASSPELPAAQVPLDQRQKPVAGPRRPAAAAVHALLGFSATRQAVVPHKQQQQKLSLRRSSTAARPAAQAAAAPTACRRPDSCAAAPGSVETSPSSPPQPDSLPSSADSGPDGLSGPASQPPEAAGARSTAAPTQDLSSPDGGRFAPSELPPPPPSAPLPLLQQQAQQKRPHVVLRVSNGVVTRLC